MNFGRRRHESDVLVSYIPTLRYSAGWSLNCMDNSLQTEGDRLVRTKDPDIQGIEASMMSAVTSKVRSSQSLRDA